MALFLTRKLSLGIMLVMVEWVTAEESRNRNMIMFWNHLWGEKQVEFNELKPIEVVCGPAIKRKRFSCLTYIPDDICEDRHANISNEILLRGSRNSVRRMNNLARCCPGGCFSDVKTFARVNSTTRYCPNYCLHNVKTHTSVVHSLDLSVIGLTYLPGGIFKHFTSLKSLNLSNNFIARHHTNFSFGLHNLASMHLSNNLLTEVALNWTKYAPSLQELYLDSNLIKLVKTSSSNTSVLKHLDLSHNKLNCIDTPLQNLLKTNVTISFDGNPLTCECMKSLQERIYDKCSCEQSSQTTSTFYIISVAFVVMSCVGLVLYIMYKYRVQPDCCRCSYPRSVINYVVKTDEQAFDYHAYIVCDENDFQYLNKILFELQTKRNLKLACDARDAQPNVFLITYIEEFLSMSKRTIFVLSPNFLGNNLCLYVLKLAASLEFLKQRCVIIFINLTLLSHDQEQLKQKLTFGKVCFDYPENPDDAKMFWDALAEAINDPLLQLKVLGIHHGVESLPVLQ